jgi:hypothetical protein
MFIEAESIPTQFCGRKNYVNEKFAMIPTEIEPATNAANLGHGTDGFTSPPKEGMVWIFSPEKSDGFDRVRNRDIGYQRAAC